ncbi:MAG TPA: hypothetical protein VK906_00740 [Egicoccus sp.]|nr:hypothetical protein [Egicoccus sp.]HSK21664.1 hypothetical protein [Egicoccus sp.]
MSEDAHEIAQRIVREVLDAHEAEVARTTPTPDVTDTGDAAVAHEIDLRDTPAALAADAAATVLDDSGARQTARRIVAEVLASHAAAEREAVDSLPVLAEGEASGPPSATPVLHPITGRPAVLPSLPDEPDLDDDADVADDAAAIARRIVASVLSQRPKADDGPPPLPDHVRSPAAVESVPEPEPVVPEPEPFVPEPEPEPVVPEPFEPEPEPVVPEPAPAPEPELSESEPEPEPEPVVVHGSHRLVAPESDEPAAPVVAESEASPPAESDPVIDTTAVLTPDEPAEADATLRSPVATLERPVARDPAAEPTLSLPSADPPRRTGRWLLASILGAVALAVLLPLAVEALRTLVSLS